MSGRLWPRACSSPVPASLLGCPTTREPGAALQEYFHQLLPKAFIFFIPGPQISHSYPLALNLLSWKFHENSLPHDFLLFHAFSLDGKLLWEQPLLLISGTCLIFFCCSELHLKASPRTRQILGTVESHELSCFWILNDLFWAADARPRPAEFPRRRCLCRRLPPAPGLAAGAQDRLCPIHPSLCVSLPCGMHSSSGVGKKRVRNMLILGKRVEHIYTARWLNQHPACHGLAIA